MSNLAFLNRNNNIDIILSQDGAVINHTLVSRILIVFETVTIDSQANPAFFDLTLASKIIFKPALTNLPIGTHAVTIITYDASNPLGIVWSDVGAHKITVKSI